MRQDGATMFRAKKRINITIRLTKKLNKEENERNMTLGTWLDDGVKDSGSRACIVAQLIRNKTADSMSCTQQKHEIRVIMGQQTWRMSE